MSNSQLLIKAVNENDIDKVNAVLAQSKKVCGYHNNALAKAVSLGRVECAIELVKFGAEAETVDDRYQSKTVAMLMAQTGCLDGLKLLFEKGAKLDRFMLNADCALREAAKNGHADCVRFLLNAGVSQQDLKSNDYTRTPINLAAENGHADVVRVLVEYGANVNDDVNRHGETPLYCAAHKGNLETVICLVELGADINLGMTKHQDNWSPLTRAAFDGHKEVAIFLVEQGADYQWKDKDGLTPSDWANKGKHPELAEIIKSLGEQKKLNEMISKENSIKNDFLGF